MSVIKGSQLKSSSSHSSWSHGSVSSSLASSLKAPDTYIKLTLMSSSGQELARSKTSLKKGQPNPIFKETFVFQVRFPNLSLLFNYVVSITIVFLITCDACLDF